MSYMVTAKHGVQEEKRRHLTLIEAVAVRWMYKKVGWAVVVISHEGGFLRKAKKWTGRDEPPESLVGTFP